jgi:formylglycine-generating enzyme required for sulfatase activity
LGIKDAAALWAWHCYPRRTVTLPGYFIDETQVTVARWKKFVRATGHQSVFKETSRHFDVSENQSLPAGKITWEEAGVCSRWAGKSLPSEAQWEKAARGTGGRFYPWGNDAPTHEYAHTGTPQKRPALYTHVGRFARVASPYGALDMIGNQY